MPSMLKVFTAGAAIGAAAAYLLDNRSGAQRRQELQALVRRRAREVQDTAQSAQASAQAVAAKAQHVATGGDTAPPDDVTLARKVETEIFREADAPKGQVNVQAVDGVVELRGQLNDRATIEELEKRTRQVTGVRDVRNLLHLPGEAPANLAGQP